MKNKCIITLFSFIILEVANITRNSVINNGISVKEISEAVGRFISWYFIRNKKEDNIIPNALLLPKLKRPDLWIGKNFKTIELE